MTPRTRKLLLFYYEGCELGPDERPVRRGPSGPLLAVSRPRLIRASVSRVFLGFPFSGMSDRIIGHRTELGRAGLAHEGLGGSWGRGTGGRGFRRCPWGLKLDSL